MKDRLEVKCPGCKNTLLVDSKSGEVLEVRKPIAEESTGDRFEDARQKALNSTERANELFEKAKKKENEKFSRLDALFKEKHEEYKDQPIEKPESPFDRD